MSSAINFSNVGNLAGYVGTDWVNNSLTFTYGGLGTPTSVSVRTRRVGDTLQVSGRGLLGTVAGSTAYVQLPTGYTIDTSKFAASVSQKVGMGNQFAGASTNLYQSGNVADIFYDGSTNNQVFFCIATVSQAYQKQNGSTIWGSNNGFIFEFQVPISGWTSGGFSSFMDSVIFLTGFAQAGSTNTRCVQFSTAQVNIGSDISYATSSVNGDTFTINTSGLYEVVFNAYAVSAQYIGFTVNSAALTTDISSITYANGNRGMTYTGGTPAMQGITRTLKLNAGDVVRAQKDGTSGLDAGSQYCQFSITRIK